ncbi:hypothetical protein D3C84_457570 [compost metagenome]
MHVGGHDPCRTAGDFAVFVDLRQGDETHFGVTGGDELKGLCDALAFDNLVLDLVGQAQPGQHLRSGEAVRGGFRVGDGQVLVLVAGQHVALGVDVTVLGRPQRQGADGVGKARAFDDIAFLLEFLWGAVVCREEHFERRTVLDLGVELPRGAIGGDQFVPGVFFEVGGNGLDRRGEVGGDGDLDFVGLGRVQGEHGEQGGQANRGKT